MTKPAKPESEKRSAVQSEGRCACGVVRFEIDVPATWAWHDHSSATRRANTAAYMTWVGTWKRRFRLLDGEAAIVRWEDPEAKATRSFCGRCGTPLFLERHRSPKFINLPRALFATRTGREPRYHMYLDQQADWTWTGGPLSPLKGYPGVMQERPRKKRATPPSKDSLFEPED
ncbi:GFA family protein [Caulobacter mirabilis]|uniref:Aldehyde-activating protein n=1 Tax=Caulobacter mirabilis TaxID=69666 RepID=A0A2D2B3G4_9CAUL|nr:GFA family protein [Caulobacter mirabilis]ATQ44802.1 aldehyde-activating protein [Caulobacter mirabilis]